jgi:hypothetical protein
MNIAKEKEKIITNIRNLHIELHSLQDSCSHPSAVVAKYSNIDIHDSSLISNWMSYSCPDCDKYWTVDL